MAYVGDVAEEPCVNDSQWCGGAVRWREPLSGSGRSFPRCDVHWDERMLFEEQVQRRYPMRPPSDWSPLDAGESWDEQDY